MAIIAMYNTQIGKHLNDFIKCSNFNVKYRLKLNKVGISNKFFIFFYKQCYRCYFVARGISYKNIVKNIILLKLN